MVGLAVLGLPGETVGSGRAASGVSGGVGGPVEAQRVTSEREWASSAATGYVVEGGLVSVFVSPGPREGGARRREGFTYLTDEVLAPR